MKKKLAQTYMKKLSFLSVLSFGKFVFFYVFLQKNDIQI